MYPRWRRNGKELYYLNLAGDMMAATVAPEAATFEAGAVAAMVWAFPPDRTTSDAGSVRGFYTLAGIVGAGFAR